jgi:hypothetical protein
MLVTDDNPLWIDIYTYMFIQCDITVQCKYLSKNIVHTIGWMLWLFSELRGTEQWTQNFKCIPETCKDVTTSISVAERTKHLGRVSEEYV